MQGGPKRSLAFAPALALFASLLGLAFAASSTLDYISHLDRQIHDLHCSFIPGMGAEKGGDSACRAAMYSPYAALMRDSYWGGVPISLFALGAFAFFAAFALYLLLAREAAPRRAAQFMGGAALTPLAASLVMAFISATRLGQFCKTCVGIYIASVLLAVAGIALLIEDRREAAAAPLPRPPRAAGVPATVVDEPDDVGRFEGPPPRREGGVLLIPSWLIGLAAFAVVPALLYTSALPSYSTYITGCGKLEKAADAQTGAISIKPAGANVPVTLFVDPLCPTCKAFHQRLVAEGYFDQLDTTLVLFPLDSDCNWMLDKAVHPGACIVSKAILCSDKQPLTVLEWAYEHQEKLLEAGKAGAGAANVKGMVRERFPELEACVDAKETGRKLDKHLRYIVQNHLPVSTPQLFVGDTRLCDEDTDIGMAYTLKKLAPQLRSK